MFDDKELKIPSWRSLANMRFIIYMSHYPELGSPLRDRYMLAHLGGSIAVIDEFDGDGALPGTLTSILALVGSISNQEY